MHVALAPPDGLLEPPPSASRWLYAGNDALLRLALERSALAGLQRIEAADLLQRKAAELRRPFLDWAADLARRNDSLEWWSSQLAARTSYTRFYERICLLATALTLAAEGPDLLVVCESPALATSLARATGAAAPPAPRRPAEPGASGRALRAWTRLAPRGLYRLPALASERARLRAESDPRYRRRVLADYGLAVPAPFAGPRTALLFTWVDRRSFAADGSYVDPHWGPLPELLHAAGYEVAFVARILHELPFAEAIGLLAPGGERFLHPDAFLSVEDRRECARRAAEFAPEIPDDATVGGVPVALLARESIEEHRAAQADALAFDPLVRKLAAAGVRPERILHPCEGHPWELVLARAVRAHLPGTAIVGYDNLNMSRLSLSMYSAPAELSIRPRPDRIVSNGPAYAEVLVEEGLPAEEVRAGCGLRHADLWKLPQRDGPAGRPLRVLVATEIDLGASVELVRKAAAAFAADDDVDLVVKRHPVLSEQSLSSALDGDADRLRFDERPTLELLAESDALLYTYTGVSFEALALGVPPVLVRSETALDLDQLEFAADLRWEGRTAEELRAAVAAVAALDPESLSEWRRRARAAAERALAPVRPECVEAFL